MIHSTVKIMIDPEVQDDALAILCAVAERTRFDSSCISCHIYQDVQEHRAIMLDEIWKNDEHFNRHLRSDDYRNVLLVMEMAVKQPEVRFEDISDVTGMETIEKARVSSM